MEKKRWVQHISGQGEKWEVFNDPCDPDDIDWQVKSREGDDCHYLPKSEYRLCDPPEVWRDVTGECVVTVDTWPPGAEYGTAIAMHSCVLYEPTHWVKTEGYRLRKVELWNDYGTKSTKQWAFIVEQKVTE